MHVLILKSLYTLAIVGGDIVNSVLLSNSINCVKLI